MAAGVSISGAVVSIVVATVLYFSYRLYQERSFYRDLPKPPHSLLWGHLIVMGEVAATMPPNAHPQAYYTALSRKYDLKGIFYLDLWPLGPAQVILSDPELSDQVTIKKPLSQHAMSADFIGPMIGYQVIAVVNGSLWKDLHRAMVPAFSWSHIRGLTQLMVDECTQFRSTLDKLAASGEAFLIEETAMKVVFDVIARVVFNFPLHAQIKGSQELDDLREMVTLAERRLDIAVRFNPWARLKLFLRKRVVLGRLHPSIITKIQERFELLKQEKIVPSRKDPNSILDLMLSDKVQIQGESTSVTRSRELTSEEMTVLLDNVKGLLVGGHGTTTDTLCFAYMLLSKNPDVVQKLRQECDQVFDKAHEQSIEILLASSEKIQDLVYMDAVLKETLRLFPVGFGVRVAEPGFSLEYNGRRLPLDNNLAICLNSHDIHYNPKFFPEPTKFQPERWLDPDNTIPRSYFRAFGRGPRGCLGQNLALNELKILLLMTVRDYDFELVGIQPNLKPRTEWTDLDTLYGDMAFQELGIEAKPRHGMQMRVKRIVQQSSSK